jgi:hypothetical protein
MAGSIDEIPVLPACFRPGGGSEKTSAEKKSV